MYAGFSMNTVYLLLCFHNHQPVGNFDHVFEANYQKAYLPFLETYEQFTDIKISLHYSGPLWDWIADNHPEYIERLQALVKQGIIEQLAGGYYEPILSMIPEHDRQGQIKRMKNFLKSTFDVDARCFWLTERVWEQTMTSSLAAAGMRCTILDDSHFVNVGLCAEQLSGFYITEDQGNMITLFGTNEQMRYLIPYKEPEEIRNYLADLSERTPGRLVVYGDDGEKFGGWPGTYKRVYSEKWLANFFAMLRENHDWIIPVTLEQALTTLKPLSKIYIPDSSYRGMMEWALPEETGRKYQHVVDVLKQQIIWNEASVFIRGGFWRNFAYKYPEINQMYSRMLEVSKKLEALSDECSEVARTYLYKAQCNCPYWHGDFGGVYLNHLRFETYRNIIRAEQASESGKTSNNRDVIIEEKDFDFDGMDEISVRNQWYKLYIQPHSGGRIYEWDYLPANTNLLDTLSRRPETYHQAIRAASPEEEVDDVVNIHNPSKFHDTHLKDHLIYDLYERKSFLDHLIAGDISAELLRKNRCIELDYLPEASYCADIKSTKDSTDIVLTYKGNIEYEDISTPYTLEKILTIQSASPDLVCRYTISHNGSTPLQCSLGFEWNFALLAGNAPDRYYFYDNRTKIGKLVSELKKPKVSNFGIVDEWQNLAITFQFQEPVTLFTFPIETGRGQKNFIYSNIFTAHGRITYK